MAAPFRYQLPGLTLLAEALRRDDAMAQEAALAREGMRIKIAGELLQQEGWDKQRDFLATQQRKENAFKREQADEAFLNAQTLAHIQGQYGLREASIRSNATSPIDASTLAMNLLQWEDDVTTMYANDPDKLKKNLEAINTIRAQSGKGADIGRLIALTNAAMLRARQKFGSEATSNATDLAGKLAGIGISLNQQLGKVGEDIEPGWFKKVATLFAGIGGEESKNKLWNSYRAENLLESKETEPLLKTLDAMENLAPAILENQRRFKLGVPAVPPPALVTSLGVFKTILDNVKGMGSAEDNQPSSIEGKFRARYPRLLSLLPEYLDLINAQEALQQGQSVIDTETLAKETK